MKASMYEWLKAEAERQGLPLEDADVEVIYQRLMTLKARLASQRTDATEALEPVYKFAMPNRD